MHTVEARSTILQATQAASCNGCKQNAVFKIFCGSTSALMTDRSIGSHRHSVAICKAAQSSEQSQQYLTTADTPTSLPGQQKQQDPVGDSWDEVRMFHTMQSRLNYKYPRACKMLLVFWSMAALRKSPKVELSSQDLYDRSHHCLWNSKACLAMVNASSIESHCDACRCLFPETCLSLLDVGPPTLY